MVHGEWTLVDHADTDGKRFLLAKRNLPGVRDLAALTKRERQVASYAACGLSLKQIGYELGLSVSTVSAQLKSGLRKLRLTSRTDLVAQLGPQAVVR
jgi:DNA-binding NarL/FixJ family response regulator